MTLPIDGWKNKGGTGDRACHCNSWKNHWVNYSRGNWPSGCSVEGCGNKAEVGAHIYNESPDVTNEYIAPFCDSCNKKSSVIKLKGGTTLVRANKQETCEKEQKPTLRL